MGSCDVRSFSGPAKYNSLFAVRLIDSRKSIVSHGVKSCFEPVLWIGFGPRLHDEVIGQDLVAFPKTLCRKAQGTGGTPQVDSPVQAP